MARDHAEDADISDCARAYFCWLPIAQQKYGKRQHENDLQASAVTNKRVFAKSSHSGLLSLILDATSSHIQYHDRQRHSHARHWSASQEQARAQSVCAREGLHKDFREDQRLCEQYQTTLAVISPHVVLQLAMTWGTLQRSPRMMTCLTIWTKTSLLAQTRFPPRFDSVCSCSASDFKFATFDPDQPLALHNWIICQPRVLRDRCSQ
jgi:hypothetical protein